MNTFLKIYTPLAGAAEIALRLHEMKLRNMGLKIVMLCLVFVSAPVYCLDCNACDYDCAKKITDVSCYPKQTLCRSAQTPFAAYVDGVAAICANDPISMSDRELIEQAKAVLNDADVVSLDALNAVEIRWCSAVELGAAAMVPEPNKILLAPQNKELDFSTLGVLIAHEWVHVDQYNRWGKAGFRCRYSEQMASTGSTERPNAVEKEAYDFEDAAYVKISDYFKRRGGLNSRPTQCADGSYPTNSNPCFSFAGASGGSQPTTVAKPPESLLPVPDIEIVDLSALEQKLESFSDPGGPCSCIDTCAPSSLTPESCQSGGSKLSCEVGDGCTRGRERFNNLYLCCEQGAAVQSPSIDDSKTSESETSANNAFADASGPCACVDVCRTFERTPTSCEVGGVKKSCQVAGSCSRGRRFLGEKYLCCMDARL